MRHVDGSRLPIELCELVIDNLDDVDDKHTLRACSLACRAFLPASRRLLFYYVNLPNRNTAKRFLHIICSIPSPISPCRYIRYLYLTQGRHGNEYLWINKALPLLAERLLEVTTLELHSFLWNKLDNIGRITILSNFMKVQSLKMMHSEFESSEQMNQFIASFPSLVDLDCSQTYWSRSIDGPLTAALPQGLQTIALDSYHSLFFHRLLSRELHPSVRALNFHSMFREYTESDGILLKTLGSSLEELNFGDLHYALGHKQCDANAVFSNDINLAHNTHLRSFHLKIFHRDVDPLTWVITLLSQIISPYMVHMTLEFQVEDVLLLSTIDWTRLENVFNQQPWSNLQKLTVYWYGLPDSERSAVEAFIRAQFPVLESRSILSIYHPFRPRLGSQ